MTTLIKIIVATILSLMFVSCNINIGTNSGIKGNGEVVTTQREVNAPFSEIKATEGLDVYLTQSDVESISVEADENLQDIILTEIENGVLKIHCKRQIGRASSKKVKVSFKDVSKISSTSGSDVYSTNTITAENLELKSTSGSDMTLDLNTTALVCKSTSGSDMRLSGKTSKLFAEATSGSDIKAADLMAESCEAKATSGADITINAKKSLSAKATSGADISYYGNPETVNEDTDASGGHIRKK